MTYFYLLEREALVRYLGVRMPQTLILESASFPSPAEGKTVVLRRLLRVP